MSAVTRQRLIDRDWQSFRQLVVPATASARQVRDMRDAFYSGATALFESLVSGVSGGPEQEITPADMQLMRDVEIELETWQAEVEARSEVKQ